MSNEISGSASNYVLPKKLQSPKKISIHEQAMFNLSIQLRKKNNVSVKNNLFKIYKLNLSFVVYFNLFI